MYKTSGKKESKAIGFTLKDSKDGDEYELMEENPNFTIEEMVANMQMISIENFGKEQFIISFQFISNNSKFPEVSKYLFDNEFHITLFSIMADPRILSNPMVVTLFLSTMINILSLPDKITPILLLDFPGLLKCIINTYSIGPPEVVSAIFETFLVLMRPTVDISLFSNYLIFFRMYMEIHNPCNNASLSVKAFQCCNQMFNIKHLGLVKLMLENDFIDICYKHMNRKTPSFFEACQLIGNIGYCNDYILEKLPDDFFTDLIPDLLKDDDDNVVLATLSVCDSLSSNNSISDIIISEKTVFNRILKTSQRNFNVKQGAVQFLSDLMERDSVYLEKSLEKYGNLEFFTDFIETGDYEIILKVLGALISLIRHFIENYKFSATNNPPLFPFVSVLQNSLGLIQSIERLMQNDDLPIQVQEASDLAYDLFRSNLNFEDQAQ